MKLVNITKGILKNYTYLELMQTISERLTAGASAVTNQKAMNAINAFKQAVATMDAAYKAATSSPLTQPLADADLARDRAYGSIAAVVNAMATSGVSAMESAAKEIQTVLNTFKVNTSAQYNEESGAIIQLCQEMDNHTTALATLSLTTVYTELKTQNELVRSLLKQRNEAQAGDQSGVMKTQRALVDNAFNAMLDHINAVLTLEASSALEQLVAVMNNDINYVRQHNGLGTSSSETTDVPDTPAENTPAENTPTPTPEQTVDPSNPEGGMEV